LVQWQGFIFRATTRLNSTDKDLQYYLKKHPLGYQKTMNNVATAITVIAITVSVIGIIQAQFDTPRLDSGYGQNTSTVTTTNSVSNSTATATSYGGGVAIASSGSVSSVFKGAAKPAKEASVSPTLPPPKTDHIAKYKQVTPAIKHSQAHLIISGTGAEVAIKEGDPSLPYAGGVISSTGADQVVFIPKGQPLVVTLSGTGAELSIAGSISKQVTVNNSGTGANVAVF
jgi:hypothetical protein